MVRLDNMNQLDINSIKEQLLDSCIVNGAMFPLSVIEEMGIHEFGIRSKLNMPLKLYKYFSNIETKEENGSTTNYSQIALINNTVYLQTPSLFDDVFDSDISLDIDEYERLRCIEYCRRCGGEVNATWTSQEAGNALIKALWPFYQDKNLEKAFNNSRLNEMEELANKEFALRIKNKCMTSSDFGTAVSNAMHEEFIKYNEYLKNIFRTACFSTTPYSQLMWGGGYADQHRGFCLEYTILPKDEAFHDEFYNLFPMIYCKTRPDVTADIVRAKDKRQTDDSLWDIYFHGALRKSIDWMYQNEWRLLLPLGNNKKDYNVKFFPITKVFLGNRMTASKRREIINICKSKGIPYVGVTRNSRLYEMQECEVLCENCSKFNIK